MAVFQGIFLAVVGAGLLGVIWRSLDTGWLPCGPNGLRGRLEFRRDRQPFGYWTMFVGYGLGGFWSLSYGLGVLVGRLEPLPWN